MGKFNIIKIYIQKLLKHKMNEVITMTATETTSPLKISLSNFDIKKKDHLQILIKKLGGVYNENLEYGTNLLVAANPISNKYKVFKLDFFFLIIL